MVCGFIFYFHSCTVIIIKMIFPHIFLHFYAFSQPNVYWSPWFMSVYWNKSPRRWWIPVLGMLKWKRMFVTALKEENEHTLRPFTYFIESNLCSRSLENGNWNWIENEIDLKRFIFIQKSITKRKIFSCRLLLHTFSIFYAE